MRRKLTVLALLTSFLVITGLSTWFFMVRSVPASASGEETIDSRLNVLILGVDAGLLPHGKKAPPRSDTLMLASFDPDTKQISLLSVPRDTRVTIPGREGKDKINHAFAYGGVDLSIQTVSNFLDLPIRYYLQVNSDGLRRLVDAIGGVPIDVEKDMDYDDYAGNLHIHLKKGFQTLNGEQAEGYVRFRHTDSDLARAARQQKFIKAAIKQALKPANLLKIGELFSIAMETVQTNIPLTVGLRYLPMVQAFQPDNITTYTVEGSDATIEGVYYWEPDTTHLQEVLDANFRQTADANNAKYKVSVRYANGDKASGERVAQSLQKLGFQVVEVIPGDRNDQKVSEVISRRSDPAGALVVARALSIPTVLKDTKGRSEADVIVIVGQDMRP